MYVVINDYVLDYVNSIENYCIGCIDDCSKCELKKDFENDK